jgi:hypothetical protein
MANTHDQLTWQYYGVTPRVNDLLCSIQLIHLCAQVRRSSEMYKMLRAADQWLDAAKMVQDVTLDPG